MRTRHTRGGSTAIEYALILPVLLTILFGAMEYSWCFVQFEAVVRAAEAGARAGSQVELTANPNPTTVAQTTAKQVLTASFPRIGNTAVATAALSSGNTILTVTLQTAYPPLLRYLPTPALLKSSASMPIENPPLPTN
jgi:Flp pilus assembly protein TadG